MASLNKNKLRKAFRILSGSFFVACGFLTALGVLSPDVALASSSDPVQVLKTQLVNVQGIYDDIDETVIGVAVFGMAMLIIKRLAYS